MPNAPKWIFDAVDRLISKLPSVEVAHVELLSRSLKRIRFTGDFRKLNFPVGSYIDFRVSDTAARRYTVSDVDTETGYLELIAHLHGEGPGRHFMDRLKVGDSIGINKPRGERRYYDKSAEKVVVFGDETSLGLACSFLPVLKKNKLKYRFIFELDKENEKVPEWLGLDNSLVFPKNASFRNTDWVSRLPVIRSTEWQGANFVLTGNVKSAQAFRKAIKANTNGSVYLHGYWLEGKEGL